MSTGVYVATAIDQAVSDGTDYWICSWLREEADCSWIFNPASAFSAGKGVERNPDIRAINAAALDRAGVLVAYLPKGTVSIGVPMEIDRAVLAGKQVLVISDAPSWMLQFDEPNVAVYEHWDQGARQWLTEALRRASEGLKTPGRTPVPTVVQKGAETPRRGYEDDAGLDLVVSEARTVEPGEFTDIPCGVSMQLPDWSWGMITGRSSTLRKRGLLVHVAVIDAGYRGPLFAGVWNMTDKPVLVDVGERIAQLIVHVNGTRLVEVRQVDALEDSARGDRGFGSTGGLGK